MTDPLPQVPIAGETLTLHPERAVWWAARETLLVADLHLGKVETFHAAAIPVPQGHTEGDLDRLGELLRQFRPRRLCVLGDLIHARAGRKELLIDRFAAWRADHPAVEMLLVRGNHDRGSGDPPASWRMQVVDAPHALAPFALQHYPDASEVGYTLAGHLHPSVQLHGAGRQRLRLPCFWFGRDVGVLPAFGGFTGTMKVQPRAGDRVFVVAEGRVLPISTESSR